MQYSPPPDNCDLCPRLANFHLHNRLAYPDFHNAPVPSFGNLDAQLLVVGLAPGLKGANRTGRPFTGDYAGVILYSSLEKYGFARGSYNPDKVKAGKGDGYNLINSRITNAVRCVPPDNKPETHEIKQCNKFLISEFNAMTNLKAVITLGQISHKAVISSFGLKQSLYQFGHGNIHKIGNKLSIINSYHTSRYNINTGTLTQKMFDEIVESAKRLLSNS